MTVNLFTETVHDFRQYRNNPEWEPGAVCCWVWLPPSLSEDTPCVRGPSRNGCTTCHRGQTTELSHRHGIKIIQINDAPHKPLGMTLFFKTPKTIECKDLPRTCHVAGVTENIDKNYLYTEEMR